MRLDEYEKAGIILKEIKKIDEDLKLLKNRFNNFIATSYRSNNSVLRRSIIIDKELNQVIIKHLEEKKRMKEEELKEL